MSKISNHLKKFFNGDLSLPYSYWAVGVLISFGVGFIAGFLSMLLMKGLALAYLIIVIWQIFITIGIWRSSDKYKGPKFWLYLAKIMMIVAWGYLLSTLGAL